MLSALFSFGALTFALLSYVTSKRASIRRLDNGGIETPLENSEVLKTPLEGFTVDIGGLGMKIEARNFTDAILKGVALLPSEVKEVETLALVTRDRLNPDGEPVWMFYRLEPRTGKNYTYGVWITPIKQGGGVKTPVLRGLDKDDMETPLENSEALKRPLEVFTVHTSNFAKQVEAIGFVDALQKVLFSIPEGSVNGYITIIKDGQIDPPWILYKITAQGQGHINLEIICRSH